MKMSNRLLLIAFAVLVVMLLVFMILTRPMADKYLLNSIQGAAGMIEQAILKLPG